MKIILRRAISLVLVLASLGFGGYYLVNHRSLLAQLGRTPLWLIGLVLVLYAVMLGVLLIVLDANLKLCKTQITKSENFLLNAYTLLINFFIPGQGGPVYRGYYLKRRHRLKVRYYIAVTLLYYLIYGIVSLMMISLGARPWWQSLILAVLLVGAGLIVAKLYTHKSKFQLSDFDFSYKNLAYLVGAVILQAIVQMIIYATELKATSPTPLAWHQIIVYTGVADLALFVALTPGAIGIREAFLVFTQHISHVTTGQILLANVVDRSVFLAFLLILLVISLSLHAKDKLGQPKFNQGSSSASDNKPPDQVLRRS